jgi:hypothetical protein
MPKKGNQELLLAIGMEISEIQSDYMLPCELCVVTFTGHIHFNSHRRTGTFLWSHICHSHHSYVQINYNHSHVSDVIYQENKTKKTLHISKKTLKVILKKTEKNV